jgi:hypothetical protein
VGLPREKKKKKKKKKLKKKKKEELFVCVVDGCHACCHWTQKKK